MKLSDWMKSTMELCCAGEFANDRRTQVDDDTKLVLVTVGRSLLIAMLVQGATDVAVGTTLLDLTEAFVVGTARYGIPDELVPLGARAAETL